MPHCNLAIEDLSQLICRKAAFEGYVMCTKDSSECKACWLETYTSDITVTDAELEHDLAVMEENDTETSSETDDFLSVFNTALMVVCHFKYKQRLIK